MGSRYKEAGKKGEGRGKVLVMILVTEAGVSS